MKITFEAFFDYTYAPAIVLGYFLALIFGLCTLQKAVTMSPKKRSLLAFFMIIITLSYVLEGLFNVYQRQNNDDDRSAPQHAMFRIFTGAPVWTVLAVSLLMTECLLWNPYVGVFVVGFLFETIATALLLAARSHLDAVSLCLSVIRTVVALALSIISNLSYTAERHSEEEAQPLLGHGNADITPWRRPAEPRNWIEYLQGFAIFMPHLLPWHDSKILSCLAIRLVIALLNRVLNVVIPWLYGTVLDKLIPGSGTLPRKAIVIWTIGLLIDSRSGLDVPDRLANNYIHNSSFKQVSTLAMAKLMKLSSDFHSSKNTGESLKAIDQAGSLNSLVELLIFQIIPVVFDLIIAMVYVAHLLGAYLTLAIFGISATYISLGIVSSFWIRPKQRIYTEIGITERGLAYELVSNWITITLFGRIQHELRRYGTKIQDYINASDELLYRVLWGNITSDLIMTAGFVGCNILAMTQVALGKTSIGILVNFTMYWGAVRGTIKQLTSSYERISTILANAERLLRLLRTEPSVTDSEMAKELDVDAGEIQFKDVSFAYEPHKLIIKKLDLLAEAGKTTAIVGQSGAGKSTILMLLNRLYNVCEGSITIDGQDIRDVTGSSLHSAIGIVPQSPGFFNCSIMENVRYGRLNATDEEVIDACKAAAMDDCIRNFPDSYQSTVGENGVKLSGGQLQRLAIARVLLKNPKIVVLDEATSSVDAITEAAIQQAISRLSSRTVIIIAHRLSTVVRAHSILVMQEGKIVESGTHDELMVRGGKYNELWTANSNGVSIA